MKNQKFWEKLQTKIDTMKIQTTVFLSFTITTILVVLVVITSMYSRFSSELTVNTQQEKQILVDQVKRTTDTYLRNMMKVGESLYSNVIKNTDLTNNSIRADLQLVLDMHKDNILNVALFDANGVLLEAAPAATIKENCKVQEQDWFIAAQEKTENTHFSDSQIQNVFEESDPQYTWVIPMSLSVEITRGKRTSQGVLLIYLRYNSIQEIVNNTNLGNNSYIYMVSPDGQLIYHPRQYLVEQSVEEENNEINATYQDGVYQETFLHKKRTVTVKTVSYTGWKIIGVSAEPTFAFSSFQSKIFIVFVIVLFVFIITLLNRVISKKVTMPIQYLEESVLGIESDLDDSRVYKGGTYEVRRLGTSIQGLVRQMKSLMASVNREHDAKRKSELDALHAQINPHFLYNTLDIIVWMIENERPDEAVRVVTALARFFRISLSKGQNKIPLTDEMEHVNNYLAIQTLRFKNRFTYSIEIGEETESLESLKLILQPITENAVYHGMEFMNGDGEILIKSWKDADDLYITVADNGLGMSREQVDRLMSKEPVDSKTGSGIGLWNINERIRLTYGENYGIKVETEPDEGTTVTVHLPAVDYKQEEKKNDTF